jgi:uncharacterized protein YbaR (Trm112 family)
MASTWTNELKCPICKTSLVITDKKRLESLEEHVFNIPPTLKDAYTCPNTACIAFLDNLIWNENGEFYCDNIQKKYPFIDNNNAPFGSWGRKANVEIYKHDEDFYLFHIKNTGIKIIYKYTADKDGIILKRKRKLEFIYNNTIYISGISMLYFILSAFYIDKEDYKNMPSSYTLKNLNAHYEAPSWDNRWWRKVALWYVKTFYPKYKLFSPIKKWKNI